MSNDSDFFLKQMRGVTPIKKINKVRKEEPKTKNTSIKKNETKKTKSVFFNPKKIIKNSQFNLEKIDLKKGIKKGSFKIDRKIDFHGKTLSESEDKFNKTIIESYNNGQRCLLFITGKGLYRSKKIENNNQPKLFQGVIRSAFFNWVKSKRFSKFILSFEQASVEHGGSGAFYVYLRKKN